MIATELTTKTYFSNFEIESFIAEPSIQYGLFEIELEDIQASQIQIFNLLETGISFYNAPSFGNQVHFQNAYQTPVQRWFPYREGYSIQLVNAFLKELKINGIVFDPFSGSGTTLLASRQNELNSIGIDVNPISILVSEVENEKYNNVDKNLIINEIKKIKDTSKSKEIYETPFELAEKIFNHEILQSLLFFKVYIDGIQNDKTKNLFFIAWLSIIEEVSNIKKEGNGLKYKNRKRTPSGYINIGKETWENQVYPDDKFNYVKIKLIEKLNIIISDIQNNYGACNKKPRIFKGSCLDFTNYFPDEIQFTFYSPPYCNCFDYFEIHKVELWIGEFIKNKDEFRLLRNTGFRSNTNSLNHKPVIYKNENLEKLISLFDRDRLWSQRIPNVVRGYFDDTYTLLNKLFQRTIKGGFVGIVVGNSAYSGVIIPTDVLITDIAKEIGFKIKNVFITRHLTTSSQQKQGLEFLKNYLRESIILLEK